MSVYVYAGMAALSILGGNAAAKNARETAELNQKISDMNAQFADLDAYDAEIAGMSEATRYQSVIDETYGEQANLYAAADIDATFGTAAAILEETQMIGELNKIEIMAQARKQALGYTTQARNYRLGGYLGKLEGDVKSSQAKAQGYRSAISTGLDYKNSLR